MPYVWHTAWPLGAADGCLFGLFHQQQVDNATLTYRTIELQKGLRFDQACNTSCQMQYQPKSRSGEVGVWLVTLSSTCLACVVTALSQALAWGTVELGWNECSRKKLRDVR